MYEKRSNVGKWLRRGAAGVLSLILLFSLIQPGLAGAEQNYICGKEAHTHGEGCYETKTETVTTKVLKCSLDVPAPAAEDGETAPTYVHAHNDDCYEGEDLVCPLEEIEAHTHEASCYGTEYQCGKKEVEAHQHSDACQKELICTETAEDHEHVATCWQAKDCTLEQTEGHAHSAECGYNLTCEKPVVVLHSHSENCYAPMTVAEGEEEQEPKLTCTTPVVENHEHDENCWEEKTEEKEVKTLICGKEEHEHAEACVEKEEEQEPDLTCGKEEHVHTEECYAAQEDSSTQETPGTQEEPAEKTLTCGKEEHTHDETCEAKQEVALKVATLNGTIYTDSTYQTKANDTTVITVTGKLPENAKVCAYPITVTPIEGQKVLCAYDIEILLEDGTVYEPAEGDNLTVSIVSDALKNIDTEMQVYHVPEDGREEKMTTTESDKGISFVTNHFTPYAVTTTAKAGTLLEQLKGVSDLVSLKTVVDSVVLTGDNATDLSSLQWGDVNTYIAKAWGWWTASNASTVQSVSQKLYEIRDKIENNAVQAPSVNTIDVIENDNVNIHLFNYGAAINTQQSGMGFLPFAQGSYETFKRNPFIYSSMTTDNQTKNHVSYEDKSEMDGEGTGHASSPVMAKTLVNGYPYVTQDWAYNDAGKLVDEAFQIKAGSLQYLFDKSLGKASGDTGNSVWNGATLITNTGDRTSNVAYTINGANSYAVSHYTAKELDSRLFKDASGYYYYNSQEHAAYFDPSSGQFEVYNTTVVPKYNAYRTNTSGNTGNFLPFNKITAQTAGTVTSLATLKEPVTETVDGNSVTSYKSIVRENWDGAASYLRQEQGSELDLWFGMSADFKFNMPKDGIQNGQSMTYEFFGDDDVFVYIDGVLVLSIGGCHAPFNGSINFANGDVMYEQIKNYDTEAETGTTRETKETINTNLYELYQEAYNGLTDEQKATPMGQKINQVLTSGFVEKTVGGKTVKIFKDYTQHDFNFFYMERGGNISAMKMKFNMEPVPPAKVSLTKDVEGKNDAIADNQTYQFEITAIDPDGNHLPSLNYYVYENDATDNELHSVEPVNGKFTITLSENQTAKFDGLTAGTVMSFKENDDNTVTSKKEWSATGVTGFGEGEDFTLAENADVKLTCTNTRKVEDLSVEKAFENKQLAENDQFPIKVTFGGKPYTGTAQAVTKQASPVKPAERTVQFNQEGIGLVYANEEITITGIPTGYEYTVEEQNPNTVTGNSDYSYLFNEDGYPTYTFTDTATDGKRVISDESAVTITNKHAVADLEIRKVMAPTTEQPIYDSFKVNVTINSDKLTVGKEIEYVNADGTTGKQTVTTAGTITLKDIIVKAGNQVATIKRIPYNATYTIEETSGFGYDASYTYSLTKDSQGAVNTDAAVSTGTVTNKEMVTPSDPNEDGAVVINVTKKLQNPDKKEHTFGFSLTEVTANNQPVQGGVNQTKTVTFKGESTSESFPFDTLTYETSDLAGGTDLKQGNEVVGKQKKFYYRIVETTVDDGKTIDADESEYIVEVTLTGKQDYLEAEITGYQKGTADVFGVTFNNTILGTLTVKKSIYGGDANDNFKFQLKTADWVNGEYDYEKKSGNGKLTFVNGVAEFHLRDGESLTLYGLPHGLEVQVHEVGTDKYAEFYKVNSSITREGQTVKVDVESKGTTVKYINYEVTSSWLPQTGQLKWPVLVLAALGIGFIGFGFLTKKRKKNGK